MTGLSIDSFCKRDILFAIGERGGNGLGGRECTEEGIKAVEAMLRKADLLNLLSRLDELRLDGGHGEVGSERGGLEGGERTRTTSRAPKRDS